MKANQHDHPSKRHASDPMRKWIAIHALLLLNLTAGCLSQFNFDNQQQQLQLSQFQTTPTDGTKSVTRPQAHRQSPHQNQNYHHQQQQQLQWRGQYPTQAQIMGLVQGLNQQQQQVPNVPIGNQYNNNNNLNSNFGSSKGLVANTNSALTKRRNQHGSRPFVAKPGNVIVHFSRNHEIQRLQYVLADGRLATLFEQNQFHGPTDGPLPVEVKASGPMKHRGRRPSSLARAMDSSANLRPRNNHNLHPSNNPRINNNNDDDEDENDDETVPSTDSDDEPQMETPQLDLRPNQVIDHDQTIDILNSKMESVAQLIGANHITVPLIRTRGAIDLAKEPNNDNYEEAAENEQMDLFATIAVDALEKGVIVGEKKIKKVSHLVMDKLKHKVGAKLHDLPELIATHLSQKSAPVGHIYIEKGNIPLKIPHHIPQQLQQQHVTIPHPHSSHQQQHKQHYIQHQQSLDTKGNVVYYPMGAKNGGHVAAAPSAVGNDASNDETNGDGDESASDKQQAEFGTVVDDDDGFVAPSPAQSQPSQVVNGPAALKVQVKPPQPSQPVPVAPIPVPVPVPVPTRLGPASAPPTHTHIPPEMAHIVDSGSVLSGHQNNLPIVNEANGDANVDNVDDKDIDDKELSQQSRARVIQAPISQLNNFARESFPRMPQFGKIITSYFG